MFSQQIFTAVGISSAKGRLRFWLIIFIFVLFIIATFSITLTMAMALLLVHWLAGRIDRSLQRLLAEMRKMDAGHEEERIPMHRFKYEAIEVQEIGLHFNYVLSLAEKYKDAMKKSEERFRLISEHSSDMITVHDMHGKYLYVSKAGKEILQYDTDELIGLDGYLFIHPEDIEHIRKNHEILLKEGHVVSTYRIRRKDGKYIWFESALKRLKGKKEDEPQLICISRNVTERKHIEEKLRKANEMLKELSMKDGLTCINNRRAFDERLEEEWDRAVRQKSVLSLIMLDIDNFKMFNDTYGHQAGDDCLKDVAYTAQMIAKKFGGAAFRYGGEEFSVILPNADAKEAKQAAENIREEVEKMGIPHMRSGVSPFVTVSLGVYSMSPDEQSTTKELIEGADLALYEAKRSGKNCVKVYSKKSKKEILA